jgi:hypothetical protein
VKLEINPLMPCNSQEARFYVTVGPEAELIRDATGKCAADALPALQRYADRVGLPLEEARFLFNRRMEKAGL